MTASSSKILTTSVNTMTIVDELLPVVLHPLILEYLIQIIAENPYKYNRQSTFLDNIAAAYTTYISHNLVWNIKVDETLAFTIQQPQSLLIEVEIKDPHAQRMRGTTLKILRMVGDCNPRELKPDEKDYGLVQRIRPAFSSVPDEYKRQSEEWHKNKDSEEAQKIRMRCAIAIETLCRKICESNEITDYKDFEKYLNSPMANAFREAIRPDPNHVVTAGFVWDFRIFLDFFRIFENYANPDKVEYKSRPKWSHKGDLVDAIVYLALWSRVPRNDVPHAENGIGANDKEFQLPARIDYSNGVPKDLVGFGRDFFFGFYGRKSSLTGRCCGGDFKELDVEVFQKLYQAKIS